MKTVATTDTVSDGNYFGNFMQINAQIEREFQSETAVRFSCMIVQQRRGGIYSAWNHIVDTFFSPPSSTSPAPFQQGMKRDI